MADLQFSGLPPAAALGSTDIVPVQQGGVTSQSTPAAVATYVGNNLPSASVTLVNLANIPTTTIVGNASISSAAPAALTGTQATALLNTFTSSLKGLVPPSSGGTTNFLRADGNFAAPPGGGGTGTVTSAGISSTDLSVVGSPITTSGSITLNVNANAVTNAKLAQMPTLTMKGNNTGGTANAADLTVAQINTMLGISTSVLGANFVTPFTYGAVGNGVTDDTTAVQTAVTTGFCYLPPGFTFLVSSPIQVPSFGTLCGAGQDSVLTGSSVSGGVVQFGNGGAIVYQATITNFAITGTATYAVKTNQIAAASIDNLFILGTFTDGLWCDLTFGCSITRIYMNGSTISNACFHFLSAFSANSCAQLYTTSTYPTYGFQCDATGGAGGTSHGSVFNSISAQGPTTGLFVGASWTGHTFNAYYSENVAFPIVLGNLAGSKLCEGIVINGATLGGPVNTHTSYSSRTALVTLDNCNAVELNGCDWSGSFNIKTIAPISFTGGTGSGAVALSRCNASGAVSSVQLMIPGTYTVAPTAVIGGAGTGAAITVGLSAPAWAAIAPYAVGQIVSLSGTNYVAIQPSYNITPPNATFWTVTTGSNLTLTLTNGGSGYVASAPMPVIYNSAQRCVIKAPWLNSGFGTDSPFWPWVVRTSAASSGAGVDIENDIAWDNAGNLNASANMKRADSFSYKHFVTWKATSGIDQIVLYQPPAFP